MSMQGVQKVHILIFNFELLIFLLMAWKKAINIKSSPYKKM